MDFAGMAELCAPNVAVGTLQRIVTVESSHNPFAIGVVGGRLERQPRTRAEAVATAAMLQSSGYDYSVGLAQVNQKNFSKFGLTYETAFDPCTNLKVGALILEDCFRRAGNVPNPLGDALSCYYTGNFKAGYKLGYVTKVLNADVSGTPAVAPIGLAQISSTDRRTKPRPKAKPSPVADALFVSDKSTVTQAAGGAGEGLPSDNKPSTALIF